MNPDTIAALRARGRDLRTLRAAWRELASYMTWPDWALDIAADSGGRKEIIAPTPKSYPMKKPQGTDFVDGFDFEGSRPYDVPVMPVH